MEPPYVIWEAWVSNSVFSVSLIKSYKNRFKQKIELKRNTLGWARCNSCSCLKGRRRMEKRGNKSHVAAQRPAAGWQAAPGEGGT